MHGPYLLYRTILTAIVKIQSMARMHLCRKRYLVMLKERDDRVATMMQHWGRRCMFRIKLWRVLNWKWLERQRRVKLKRMRRIYRHSLPINGAMYIIGIYRSHIFAPKNRRYVVEIFQPVTCTMYQLEAHESRVHEIIMASSMKQRHPSECFQSSSDFVAIIQRMLIYKGRLQWSKRQRCMGRVSRLSHSELDLIPVVYPSCGLPREQEIQHCHVLYSCTAAIARYLYSRVGTPFELSAFN